MSNYPDNFSESAYRAAYGPIPPSEDRDDAVMAEGRDRFTALYPKIMAGLVAVVRKAVDDEFGAAAGSNLTDKTITELFDGCVSDTLNDCADEPWLRDMIVDEDWRARA